MQRVRLSPFPSATRSAPESPILEVEVSRSGTRLELVYSLSGPVGTVDLPGPAPAAARKDRLWERTCFEAFLGAPGETRYWELNVSPTLDWAVYRFDDYRQGHSVEARVPGVGSEVLEHFPGSYRLRAVLDLSVLPVGSVALDLGLAAVLDRLAGGEVVEQEFWALRHAGAKPDFHLRESFALRI